MSRDADEDALYDAAHDAFLRDWLALDTDAEDELWAAYCAAEQRLEQWLREREQGWRGLTYCYTPAVSRGALLAARIE